MAEEECFVRVSMYLLVILDTWPMTKACDVERGGINT